MKKYLVEFIGTFFLVLTIGAAAIHGSAGVLAPLAIGAALLVMVYAGGHVSGAHYNPAVTLAVLLRGRCSLADAVPYVVAQLAGAGAAVVLSGSIFPGPIGDPIAHQAVPSLVAEVLFTFALVWVVLNVATAKGTQGNSFYGLAIAATVVAGAFAVGGISGGAFNPAVAFALSLWGKSAWGDLWIYLAGNFGGSLLAAFTYLYVNGRD